MSPFHRRMAELWCKAVRGHRLTTREKIEWIESHHAHMQWVSELNRLENLRFCAELVNDREELNRLRKQIDRLKH